jgi:hypothetical protein
MARQISASVGRLGGVNRQDDVVTVQALLNQVTPADGGPTVLLVLDGKCGPKTIKAIQIFQLKHFGWPGADGRVDPDGPTLARLNTFDQTAPIPQPAPTPQPQALPTSTQFVIHRMGSATSFVPVDRELFFHITDMINGLIGIYWFKEIQQPMTVLPPPTHFTGASRSFLTKAPLAVDSLRCPSMYASREASKKVTSNMVLFLGSGAVQLDMPHHMIGPNGLTPAGQGDVSVAIGGDLRFVKMG